MKRLSVLALIVSLSATFVGTTASANTTDTNWCEENPFACFVAVAGAAVVGGIIASGDDNANDRTPVRPSEPNWLRPSNCDDGNPLNAQRLDCL
jgi:hypothetical protein